MKKQCFITKEIICKDGVKRTVLDSELIIPTKKEAIMRAKELRQKNKDAKITVVSYKENTELFNTLEKEFHEMYTSFLIGSLVGLGAIFMSMTMKKVLKLRKQQNRE